MRFLSVVVTLFSLLPGMLSAQTLTIKKPSGDLENAIKLQPNQSYIFANSPTSFGFRQEYPKSASRSSFVFKEERNTVWLLLPISSKGIFSFEILPKSPKDDFDWMVYKYNSRLRNEIAKDVARPVRSNISRNDGTVAGRTGMREGFQNNYAVPGPGRSFSKPLDVKPGDTLAIIIDNIYDNGGGFTFNSKLSFNIPLLAVLKGKVLASDAKVPLAAKIICEDDSTGLQLSQATANAAGEFSIKVPQGRPVNVIASYTGYIFKTEDVEIAQNVETVNFSLDPVASGNKAILFNIHFAPNQDVILPNAAPDILRLINFLNDYPQFDIRIVGHTNNNPFEDPRYLQKLSFNRSMAVKKRLITNGISEERLSCMGVGGKMPLTNSRVFKEAMKNLRVEIELKERAVEETALK